MAKFNTKTGAKQAKIAAAPKGALQTTGARINLGRGEGALGYETDTKTELFRMAATNMVGENKFYEPARDGQNRFAQLIHAVTAEDPEWIQRFIPFLRNNMFMRSASIVMAAEYAAAGGPNVRQVVASAMSRADEPGEFIGYWLSTYGRTLAGGKQRGVADAAVRLINEYSALKYDGTGNEIRLGDVIELTHPKAKSPEQSDLFRFLLDRRHRGTEARYELDSLPRLQRALQIDQMTPEQFEDFLGTPSAADFLKEAGYTWERLSSKTKMDKRAWELIIPSMGVMALVRNLRNFDQAGISKESRDYVISQITDPEVIARSKMFPYRFWTAYRETESAHYTGALEEGLNLATQNVPEFSGRTLVLIDGSGSMQSHLSAKSSVQYWEPGAVFAAVQAMKCDNVDLVLFATSSVAVPFGRGASTMRLVEKIQTDFMRGQVGYGTNTFEAINKHYKGHDRVIIFSDLQAMSAYGQREADAITAPIYSFDLAGYKGVAMPAGKANRYLLAGFSDACFSMIPMLEAGEDAGWPF